MPGQPGFQGVGRVAVNDVDAEYVRQPSLKLPLVADDDKDAKSIASLANAWDKVARARRADLLIRVPDQCLGLVQDRQMVLLVHIDLLVVRPKEVGTLLLILCGAILWNREILFYLEKLI